MAIGIRSSGNVDFDDLFERRETSKINNTGLQTSAGTDISNRYERLSSGSAISSNTGVQNSGGTDCRDLFCAIGSIPPPPSPPPLPTWSPDQQIK